MTSAPPKLIVFAVLAAALAAPAVAHAQAPVAGNLLTPALEPSARTALGSPGADEARQRAVRIDDGALERAALSGGSWSARLSLFDGETAQVLLTSEPAAEGAATTWTGYLLDDPASTVVATYHDGQLVADLWTSVGSYRIRPAGRGLHRLVEIDDRESLPELPPIAVDAPTGPRSRIPGLDLGGSGDDGPADLDLLFAYTPSVRRAAGGESAVHAQVLNMVAWMNLSLTNNGHAGRARIVGVVPTEQADANDLLDGLEALRDGDGALRQLHEERDRVGADMVILVQEEGNGCGLSYLMQSAGSSFSSYAFGVVLRECTTSLAHEVGHLLGAQHEREATSHDGLFSYSHGTVAAAGGWRTVMSTGRACLDRGLSCPRIPYLSDPATSFAGEVLGEAASSDNARTVASSWGVASGFRRRVSDLDEPGRLRLRSRKGRVVLKWKKSARVEGYVILRSTDDGGFETVGRAGGTARKFVDRKVNMRTTGYCYQVAATTGTAQAIAGPVCTGR